MRQSGKRLLTHRIRFSSGAIVYVTLNGTWYACPDFSVTDAEIARNIELISFEVESE